MPPDGEPARADGRAGAERAGEIGAPLDVGAQVAVLDVRRLPGETHGEVRHVVDGAVGRGGDAHHRRMRHDDGDVGLGGEPRGVGHARADRVHARGEHRVGEARSDEIFVAGRGYEFAVRAEASIEHGALIFEQREA